ncbi:DUF262 domain-containing protein [Nitrosococcus watsonii]|nr:DUF262 domain-containing protein [Nitrosococcus watsonii]
MTTVELVEHFNHNSKSPRIHLPIIQRDAVWKTVQVCELWDSLLCGMPIPSSILCEVTTAGTNSLSTRDLSGRYDEKTEFIKAEFKVKNGDYMLLDGQQRCNAIRLGYAGSKTERLWLDLGWEKNEQRRFGFFLCSLARPWGDKPDLSERAAGRTVREARRLRHESNYPLNGQFDFQIPLSHTWPVYAKAPIPILELLKEVLPFPSGDSQTQQIYLESAVQRTVKQTLLPPSIRKKVHAVLEKWRQDQWMELLAGIRQLDQPVISAVITQIDNGDLLRAFRRLNQNGTDLKPAELFFSGLKNCLPESASQVHQLHTGKRQVFSELDTLRALTVLSSEKLVEQTELNFDLLKALGLDSNSKNQEKFKKFQNRIFSYFGGHAERLINRLLALIQRGDTEGLPIVMLPRLRSRTWLPVLSWLDVLDQAGHDADAENHREAVLRFMLTDHFFSEWRKGENELLRAMLQLVKKGGSFPSLREFEELPEAQQN